MPPQRLRQRSVRTRTAFFESVIFRRWGETRWRRRPIIVIMKDHLGWRGEGRRLTPSLYVVMEAAAPGRGFTKRYDEKPPNAIIKETKSSNSASQRRKKDSGSLHFTLAGPQRTKQMSLLLRDVQTTDRSRYCAGALTQKMEEAWWWLGFV